jgi:hypothetical protein
MTRITVKISLEKEPGTAFTCYEPDTAWCRQNELRVAGRQIS